MDCTETYDFKVTRGDVFELDVGLTEIWAEIVAQPQLYVGRLVFRDAQDDALPELLVLTADPEVEIVPEPADATLLAPAIYFHFDATPAQTQSLPERRCSAYAEVRTLDGAWVRRLFNSRVSLGD